MSYVRVRKGPSPRECFLCAVLWPKQWVASLANVWNSSAWIETTSRDLKLVFWVGTSVYLEFLLSFSLLCIAINWQAAFCDSHCQDPLYSELQEGQSLSGWNSGRVNQVTDTCVCGCYQSSKTGKYSLRVLCCSPAVRCICCVSWLITTIQ